MNFIRTFSIFLTVTAVLFSYSCQKDFDYEISNGGPDTAWLANVPDTAEINQLKHSLKPVTVLDSFFYNNQTANVTLRSGLELSFPTGLSTSPGTIASGNLKIESILLKKKGDFIRMGIHTRENNRMLSSVGASFLRITKNGELVRIIQSPLEIRYNSGISVPYPAIVFNDTNNITPANWVMNNDTLLNNVISTIGFHMINTKKTGWINAAVYADTGNAFSTIQIALPAHYTNTNTAAFLVYDDAVSVDILRPDISLRRFVSLPVPSGRIVRLLVISKQAGNYFFSQTVFTVAGGSSVLTVPVTPTLSSLVNILDALNNL